MRTRSSLPATRATTNKKRSQSPIFSSTYEYEDDSKQTPTSSKSSQRKTVRKKSIRSSVLLKKETEDDVDESENLEYNSPAPVEAQSREKTPDSNKSKRSHISSSKKLTPDTKVVKSHNKNIHSTEIEFEFCGPIGVFFIIFGLPLVISLLYYTCNKDICLKFETFSSLSSLSKYYDQLIRSLPTSLNDIINIEAVYIYAGWMIFHILCERLLPGETVEGVTLKNGGKLKYVMSGHLQFWLCIFAMGHGLPIFIQNKVVTSVASSTTASVEVPWDWIYHVWNLKGLSALPLHLVYDYYAQLITVSVLGAGALSIYLYISSFRRGALLAEDGNTGYPIYDFFIGTSVNLKVK